MKRAARRIFVGVVAALVVVSFVVNRASRLRGKSCDKLVVLSRLWSQPHEKEFVISEIVRPFEMANDCRVDFQTLDDDALLKRAMVQKSTGQVSADVVVVYVSRMQEWVDNGYVRDLTSLAESWNDRTFLKGFRKMTVFDGKQYFLPVGGDNYLLCANKKAIPYLPPEAHLFSLTWEHLADWALKVREGEGEGKFAFTGVAQKMLIYQVGCAILSYGGGFPDVASPQAVEAWRPLVRMRDAFCPTIRTYDSVVPAMKRGEAWITVAHSARVGEVYSSNPAGFVVAPPPAGPAGIGSVAGVSGFAILEGCQQPDLAAGFIEYMTRPETQLKLARGTGGFIPTVNEAANLPEGGRREEVMRNAMHVLDKGVLAYIPPSRDWAGIKLVFDELFGEMVLDRGRLDAATLEAAQQRIDSLGPVER